MWKKLVHVIESEIDDIRYGIERLAGIQKPLQIKAYTGYGNQEYLRVTGRVLARRDIPAVTASDAIWKNFVNISKNWLTDEVPGARIETRYEDTVLETVADEEGYFEIQIPWQSPRSGTAQWPIVELTLLDPVRENPVREFATIQVPGVGGEFGIISDIDDTIMETGATNFLRAARNTFLGNAHTRVVFSGVSALYAALARGRNCSELNPFFYITSSPWNLYDFISHIFELRNVPRGTLFMTDWGIDEDTFLMKGHHSHKKHAIRQVLDTYPELRFVCIGDSGQKDPEIYTEMLDEYPDRFLAFYIRDVTGDKRDKAVTNLIEKASGAGVDMILAEESYTVAQHAAEIDLIRKCELPAILGREKADLAEAEEGG
ncbi:MAG: DUF2183 domain-containing protein [Verrucomicrobiales bacterium]|nr:DUF2183 domain-containing protein [Verrucomicrobiales bacterium]